jgi:dTDP-L-rhamnose 4-epimerase
LIYEDGRQTRDFTFVADVARANLLVAGTDAANYQVFNVGTGRATTVLDFVHTLGKIYGREVRLELRGEFRLGDARHLVTDASRLRSLGWSPQVPIEEGLRRYAAWIQASQT